MHGRHDRPSALARAVKLLGRMGLTAPERAIAGFPHQFSGGMRQRVMLAMGFSNEPSLLIADEPTTALDVTIQAQILDLLRELNADFGAAIILISHDLGVIANVCSRVVVMYAGEVVEEGSTEALLCRTQASLHLGAAQRGAAARPTDPRGEAPHHDRRDAARSAELAARAAASRRGVRSVSRSATSTRSCCPSATGDVALLGNAGWPGPAAARASCTQRTRHGRRQRLPSTAEPILEMRGLVKHFPVPKETACFRKQQAVHAVDGVDLSVQGRDRRAGG